MKNGSETRRRKNEVFGSGGVVDDSWEEVGRTTRRSRSGVERDDGGEVGRLLSFSCVEEEGSARA